MFATVGRPLDPLHTVRQALAVALVVIAAQLAAIALGAAWVAGSVLTWLWALLQALVALWFGVTLPDLPVLLAIEALEEPAAEEPLEAVRVALGPTSDELPDDWARHLGGIETLPDRPLPSLRPVRTVDERALARLEGAPTMLLLGVLGSDDDVTGDLFGDTALLGALTGDDAGSVSGIIGVLGTGGGGLDDVLGSGGTGGDYRPARRSPRAGRRSTSARCRSSLADGAARIVDFLRCRKADRAEAEARRWPRGPSPPARRRWTSPRTLGAGRPRHGRSDEHPRRHAARARAAPRRRAPARPSWPRCCATGDRHRRGPAGHPRHERLPEAGGARAGAQPDFAPRPRRPRGAPEPGRGRRSWC
ncbi:MAG: hypothetical protein R3F59_36080 [Myxococcota bacterium]